MHFTVTGEFLTNISRTLWADEGEPEKALHILQAAFPEMPQSAMFDVLTGKQRLVGDSNAGILLEPDDALASEHGNNLSLESVLKRFRNRADKGEDWMQMATRQTELVSSPKGLVEVPRRRTKYNEAKMCRSLDVDLEDIPHREVGPFDRERKFFDADTNRQRQELNVEEAEPPTPPRPERSITTDTGWLAPDGKYYPCDYGQHDVWAYRLGFEEERQLEKLGWVKVQRGSFYRNLLGRGEPTQRQVDMVFDYCQKTGEKLPYWIGEEND